MTTWRLLAPLLLLAGLPPRSSAASGPTASRRVLGCRCGCPKSSISLPAAAGNWSGAG